MQKRAEDNFLTVFINGMIMGIANKIPGVSGGLVAFVLGFYEKFIFSLSRLNIKSFGLLLRGRFRSFLNYVQLHFLFFLFLGVLVSYFSLAKILDYLLNFYELHVWSLFFGLVLGSIYHISKQIKYPDFKAVLLLLLGLCIGYVLVNLTQASENDKLWYIFLCGIVSVSGMTLPGLSGSFLLILMGNYVLLLVDSVNILFEALKIAFQGDINILWTDDKIRSTNTVLLVFLMGSITGLVAFSHMIKFIYKRYQNQTELLILGFIIGSLQMLWPWKIEVFQLDESSFAMDSDQHLIVSNYLDYLPNLNLSENWTAIFTIFLGIATVLILEKNAGIKRKISLRVNRKKY
ncbi:MAG: DUF368 domain-containing protein [Flavobacteriaceae bacterium]|nr:DUF368 domain-containing protein [Flavobacteriaceae bacterium]